MSSWMKTGWQGASNENEVREAEREKKMNAPRRFWIPSGKDTSVTFVDGDDPVYYSEHQLKRNGHFRNWFTCIQGIDGQTCPLCAAGDTPYFAVAFTVIDHSEYTDRNGKVHRDQVRLLVAKSTTFAILEKQAKKRNGLAGATFEVSRSRKDKSPGTGDIWDFEEKIDVADEFPEAKPIDYEQYLAPSPVDFLRRIAAGGSGQDDDDDRGGRGGDDRGSRRRSRRNRDDDDRGRGGDDQGGFDDDIPF